MGLLPTQADFAQLSKQIQETKLLADNSTIAHTLSTGTQFATIAFCCEVIGPLKEKMDISPVGRATSWSWEGIDEDNIQVGYLSHNGTNLRFQTKDKTVIDLPFSEVRVEAHGLGLLVKTPDVSYVIGNFMAINEQLSPDKKMNYNFGSESTIWMRELGDIGVIDKVAWEKSRSKSKQFVIIWFAVIIIISILFLAL